ncbi:MAG: response regulator transcription factor [Alphaproteobacteria bacterium]|nr:response regulator transcription factor [Alphaproteobacteria bacterium]MDE6570715.1 response regulator transcription factor [Alphaproteobacteria bacterium]
MNKTILIIDDDDMLRRTLARGLRADGFDVITAASAEDGADILDKIMVDAVVLDRMMTGMDGLTFLKNMRAGGDATPVIMLTAMTGPENAIAGLAGGADDYLAKPFQLRELVLRLHRIIRPRENRATRMPDGLMFTDDEFFVTDADGATPRILALSGEEKKLMQHLVSPVGNIAPAAPMVAKRLRSKLNGVLSNIDIITIRGRGYKLIQRAPDQTMTTTKTGKEK